MSTEIRDEVFNKIDTMMEALEKEHGLVYFCFLQLPLDVETVDESGKRTWSKESGMIYLSFSGEGEKELEELKHFLRQEQVVKDLIAQKREWRKSKVFN